ncbi:MAG: DUF4129 domain-containing protein [Anaerolineales bacterium]
MTATPSDSEPHLHRSSPWIQPARRLGVAAMLTCIAISVTQVIRAVNPAWPGEVWVVLILVVSLESMFSHQLLLARGAGSRDRGRFRFVEWVVILLVVRFALYIGQPEGALATDVAAWSSDLERFLGGGFIPAALLVACFWGAALFMSDTFAKLDAAEYELHQATSELDRYLWQTMPRHGRQDRAALLARINGFVMIGGLVMIMLTGFARVNIVEVLTLQNPRSSGLILNVLAYFVIGLLLISQAHYAALKAGWDLDRLPLWDEIGKRWLILAIGFLLAVGLLAALLPVGYSVGLLGTISAVVNWVWYILMQLLGIILFIFSLIGSLIARLLTGVAPDTAPSLDAFTNVPTPAPTSGGAGGSWWPLVRSILFWAVLLGIVGYSVVNFVRDRWGLLQGLTLRRWLSRLRGLFGRMHGGWQETTQRLREGLLRWRASRGQADQSGPARFLSIGRLSARERVRYFYLSTVRRADEAGIGRQPAQTPLEYQAVLQTASPEPENVDTLTSAFVAARYSPDEVTRDDAERAKSAWQRIKRGLVRRVRGRRP